MPLSPDFARRLADVLPDVIATFGTPFHVYDEKGIVETCAEFNAAFAHLDFRQYFAVKALPNPVILRMLADTGFGFDCSSLPELTLARMAGAREEQICFTSNNTSRAELAAALESSVLLNIDDRAILEKLDPAPPTLMVRVNPGDIQQGDEFMGRPSRSKFGVPVDRLLEVCSMALARGTREIGLHMMLASNSLTPAPTLRTLELLLEQAVRIRDELGAPVTLVNVGGGLGIPYRVREPILDIRALGHGLEELLARFEETQGLPRPIVCFESGRYITGPHGALVTRVENRMSKWRELVGVDASMSALMRPALYGAYHHITAPLVGATSIERVSVVGSLCENNDTFADQRDLPVLEEGDVLVVHDTGAHGHAMGFNYNGRLRPQEILLRSDGSVERIRRAEDERDLFATLDHAPLRMPGLELVGPR